MHTNLAVAAATRFGEAADSAIALPGPFLFRRIGHLLNEVGQQGRVPLLPEQQALRGMTVATSSSGLLVVLLD